MLLPGMKINTSPDQLTARSAKCSSSTFNGASWELFGEILQG